jgi:glycosyltransferase involved in cell wall biosynthesis
MYVGAVRRRKGIDLLLDAYRLNRTLWNDPIFICGRGEDEDLIHYAVQDGLPIRWLGQLSQEELAERFMGVRLVVIPSRLEGFSIAIQEALCCGVPVVGWAPQIREVELLLGTYAGRPFDGRTQTAAELADILSTALGEEQKASDRRPRLAAAARNAFSEARYVEAYLGLYKEMIGS